MNTMMAKEETSCQTGEIPFDRIFDLITQSYPVRTAKFTYDKLKHEILSLFSTRGVKGNTSPNPITTTTLGLQPGELVEVRSLEEIRKTLDKRNKAGGLLFMTDEMRAYCGRRFKVLKRVERYMVEGVGMRQLKNTVILDGVFCNGEFHGGCDRTCFCLWREAWLKRVDTV